MKRRYTFLLGVVITLIVPMLACGPMAPLEVTPTPTKTPRRIKLLPETAAPTPTPAVLQQNTPTPEVVDTLTPVPTDTPVAEVPTDTPPPPPTDTPLPPPPPPTNTPAPPPPTNTPAPPPPTPVPKNEGPQVDVQLTDGNKYDVGEKIKIKIVVWDPDGVKSFTWGIFTQNQVSLKGGDKNCNGATECSTHIEERIPIPGTFIIGADALDSKGNANRGLGEIYVK